MILGVAKKVIMDSCLAAFVGVQASKEHADFLKHRWKNEKRSFRWTFAYDAV